jgi:GTPase Era involved in 16S rRNA processing
MTKSQLLKKLIKEACLEAIREELPKMLKENVQPVEKKSKTKVKVTKQANSDSESDDNIFVPS